MAFSRFLLVVIVVLFKFGCKVKHFFANKQIICKIFIGFDDNLLVLICFCFAFNNFSINIDIVDIPFEAPGYLIDIF